MQTGDRIKSEFNTGTVEGYNPETKLASIKWDGYATTVENVNVEGMEVVPQ